MPDGKDWRLTKQSRYLQGVQVRFKRYQKPRPEWDHDHCSFCWAKFMETDDPNAKPDCLHEGYATVARGQWKDDYHWICATCFDDFQMQFEWKVAE
jgi:hypothetical protein